MVGGAQVRGRMSFVVVAGAALLLAACGASGGSPSPSAEAPSPSTGGETGEAYEVDTATDATLGTILVGEDGKTLYIFKKDSDGKSACNGDCAAKWPPFALEADETVTAGEGVTGTLATIARDDGSMQVTYNGAPLYYFAADTAAGDVKGQGLNDVWFVATPTGSSSDSASPSGGDEYTRGGGGASATP